MDTNNTSLTKILFIGGLILFLSLGDYRADFSFTTVEPMYYDMYCTSRVVPYYPTDTIATQGRVVVKMSPQGIIYEVDSIQLLIKAECLGAGIIEKKFDFLK